MLKKQHNNIVVSKLRAILLLKTDFNSINKIVFNSLLIPTLENNKLILKKIIWGRRGQSVIYIVVNKKLITNIVNQMKILNTIVSAVTSNCFY